MKSTAQTMPLSLREQMDRFGPWTTRFRVNGQVYGGGYEVGQDDSLLRAFRERLPVPEHVLELGSKPNHRLTWLRRFRCFEKTIVLLIFLSYTSWEDE